MASIMQGGGETFDLEMAGCLRRMGCQITFLSGRPLLGVGSRSTEPDPGIQWNTLRSPYLGWLPWDRFRGGWRLRQLDFTWFEQRAARWAWQRQGAFDIAQVCELPTLVRAARRLGVNRPVVARLTAPDFHDPQDGFRQVAAVIASGATLDAIRDRGYPRCTDIPNGVDVNRFCPGPSRFRETQGILPDTLLFLCVGRFLAVKAQELLVAAFARLVVEQPQAVLVMAGGGPMLERVRRQARAAGCDANRVRFLGETAHAELPGIYAAADVVVIPSDYESFCFAALEAMASAKPIITTATNWIPRMIEAPRGGMVVPVRDASAMAQAMAQMGRDAQVRERMGQFNRDKAVREFGWEPSAQKLLTLYEAILNSRPE